MSLFPNYGATLINDSLTQDTDQGEAERLELMRRACHAYQGTDLVINRPLKVESGKPDDNVALNYAETIVDKGVAFLFGDDLKISAAGEADSSEAKAAAAYLEEVWPEDVRSEDLIELGTNGGIFGHVWAKISITDGVPMVVVGDPECYTAEWAPDNYKMVLRFLNTYRTTVAGQPVLRRENTYRDNANAWRIDLEQRTADQASWTLIDSYPWPFPFAPVVQCKNLPTPNQFFGKPDLSKHVLALNYYINRVNSLINRIVRSHAAPKPIATGQRKVEMEMGTDSMLFLPNENAKIQLLEMQGDLEQARNFRKDLREALAEVTHVPEVTTGKTDNLGTLSGRAMRILYGPLVDQTKKKRRLYGRLVKELVGNLLVIGGKAAAEPTALGGQKVPVTLTWGEPLPADELEQAQVAVLKKQFGYSNDTLIKQTGGDPDTERTQRQGDAEEAANNMLDQLARGGPGLPGDNNNQGGGQGGGQ
jgi:hypothetical protein